MSGEVQLFRFTTKQKIDTEMEAAKGKLTGQGWWDTRRDIEEEETERIE